jgi:hypothetical protein
MEKREEMKRNQPSPNNPGGHDRNYSGQGSMNNGNMRERE